MFETLFLRQALSDEFSVILASYDHIRTVIHTLVLELEIATVTTTKLHSHILMVSVSF